MPDTRRHGAPDATPLDFLESVGFGLDSVLMNDPKILLDVRFLASIVLEFEGELGAEGAAEVLFQIGLIHGLRDAERALSHEDGGRGAQAGPRAATPIAMDLDHDTSAERGAGIALSGRWPEQFEVEARLARSGRSDRPACSLSAGYTSGWLSGAYDIDILVVEETCVARGDAECTFHARELAAWSTVPGEIEATRLDAGLYARCRDAAIDTARSAATKEKGAQSPASPAGRFDPGDDAVHIWGPVMVLPLTSIDEALCTAEMLSRDPATQEVRAVVVDLRQNPLDDAMMAVGLERLIDILCSWGAEVLLTGVSSVAEPIVCELEAAHMLTRKALPDAVAAAFQIAEAQRHAV